MNFKLLSHQEQEFELAKLNSPLVLFFYPKDNTPGCTIENQDFARLYGDFKQLGYELVGISRDNIKSHCNFVAKFNLPFLLLSDVNEEVCNLFNVIKDKNMYGKKVRGIERSTFLIDFNKNIIKEWRKVSATNHAQEVLEFIQNLKT
ncbi:MAG: peroxiredoxin [Burkholderiales bacterium]|nr:peroxiredoxin [Burkholderiales bacterium]